ncbi:uncharacterized protein LOC109821221 [Asparagus officinalis]|uniref:uncharacterized protein LOC109821221 n=1 Tax=Asparagus officinalis TaxID=4686 RepID=UPI00098E1AA5|nr:uncharacterized protein LOC109821221 [Asparagus officinalis]
MASNLLRALLQEEEDDDDDDYATLLAIASLEEHHSSESQSSRRRGSIPGHAVIQRNRAEGHERHFHDYFSESPVYPAKLFRMRFRLHRSLFLRILSAVETHDSYFVQKRDDVGKIGLSSLQKVTAAMRMLAYGVSADSVDDYVRIGESTAIESLGRFAKTIVKIFGDEYLRSPTDEDTARLLAIGKQRGFPGMLGSIDYMHWRWKNCPAAYYGMYTGHNHTHTIILEAVASYDLWIWHAYFGLPGALNDINVLERSSVFSQLAEGHGPTVNFTVNGHEYTIGYYLADGIYPSWATFVKIISLPQGNKRKHFSTLQESARKDVERAFGVLQSSFAIVRGPARSWDVKILKNIMQACIIMHNMIVEDERKKNIMQACIIMHNMIVEDERNDDYIDFTYDAAEEAPTISVSHERTIDLCEFIQNHHRIRDRQTHSQLQLDLVEHLWERNGGL